MKMWFNHFEWLLFLCIFVLDKITCMKKLLLLILIAFITFSYGQAQEMFGLINGTRSGISGARINPAFIADSRNWLDVNIFTLDVFEENNFLYIPSDEYYVGKLFQQTPNWRDYEGKPFLDFYEKNRKWDLFTQVYAQLPSAMINLGDHGFGIQFNFRQHANLMNVDNPISKFMVEGIDFEPQQNILYTSEGLSFRQASWLEAGLSYAYVFKKIARHHWSAGITVKKLFGVNSFFLDTKNTEFIVYNDSTLHVRATDLQYGYSPSPGSGNEVIDFSEGIFNGNGWSFDLGVVYQMKTEGNGEKRFNRPCEQKYDNYIFKLGLSLIDLGWIDYKRNAVHRSAEQTEIYWTNLNSYDFSGIGDFTQDLGLHASPAPASVDDQFRLFLPTAASVQFDYRFYPGWYANATLIHGIPVGELRMTMPSIVAITPRYETRWLEVNLPFMLYDWYRPRMGFAVRVFNVTIGTDYLNTLFGFRDFTGLDIYLAIKIKFEKGICINGFSDFFKGKRYYNSACP